MANITHEQLIEYDANIKKYINDLINNNNTQYDQQIDTINNEITNLQDNINTTNTVTETDSPKLMRSAGPMLMSASPLRSISPASIVVQEDIQEDYIIYDRVITPNEDAEYKNIVVTTDDSSNRVFFSMYKTFDDRTLIDKHFSVIWINAAGYKGETDCVDIETIDDRLYFAWNIPYAATRTAGTIKYAIRITTKDYVWNTLPADIECVQGLMDDAWEDLPDAEGKMEPKLDLSFCQITYDDNGHITSSVDITQAQLDALNSGVTINTLTTITDLQTTAVSLQNQINEIVRAPESGGDVGAEVYQARVGLDGTDYATLKDRLDNEYAYSVLNRNIITDISKPCLNKVLANIWNTNLSMSNYTFVDYRGYGYLCNIPDYICGIRLNLRIKSSNDGDQSVPITISIRDKDTREILWSLSKNYYISFTSQYGYVRNDLIMFDKVLVRLPVEAYFVIDVGANYTLAVTPRSWDATEYISEDLVKVDTNYKTWYLDTTGSPVVSPANAYYCDFGFYKGDVSTLSIEDVDNKIELESTKNETNTQIIRRILNPISTPPVRTRVFNTEDNDAEASYGYNSFRGYGYYCYIPKFLNGIYLNLKIYGSGTNVLVPITVSILDKDTHEFLWTISKEYTLTFNNNYAYIDHETFMFNEQIYGLPETAYVFISVSNPYKLVVVKDPPAAIVNTTLFIPDDYYHTLFYNDNDNIQVGSASYYLCDFALYSAEITDKNVSGLFSEINAIKNSFKENYDNVRGFNRDFNLTTNTYGFTDYRGYGYLINAPKTFGGVWVNVIITPDDSFGQDYTKDISISVSLKDKDTKSVIYEYSKTCEVTFTASTGVGTLSQVSIYTDEPVTNLPSQCYLCIAVPIGYRLNVTTNDSSEKFTPLMVLDENYKNLYLANNQKYTVSAGLYKYTCDIGVYDISYINNIKNNDRIYNLHDAFLNWDRGEKFPVAFAGDSTTDGSRTTNYTPNVLGTDHTTGYLYTDILQTYLRNELNNNVLRIYNAGFSGKTIAWMLSNFDAEFGSDSAYSDVKMIGVSFGINDRPNTEETYRTFKNNIITFCKKCLSNGIQPFLLTSQAGAENSNNLNRYEYKTISFANKAKKEVSDELNLEIIDVSTITANFLKYSNRPIQTILYDYCHFGDYGHKFEAGMFFKEFIPRVINIEADDKLGFESQGIKSDLQWGDQQLKQVQMLSEITNGFKTAAIVSGRTDTSDIVVMDAWVFISGKNPLDLTLYTSAVNTLYCVIDENSITITSTTQNLGTFDLGLHHIVVKSGNSSNINFYGIKFVKSTS